MLGLKMDDETAGRNYRNRAPGEPDDRVCSERAEENLRQRGVLRRQVPPKLAYCTIHRFKYDEDISCGLVKNIFEPGMAYGALRRATLSVDCTCWKWM
ncbi:hypothetical protein KUCAC02_035750 [Chaenocephalus aceratus]|nr:hypothetical protein KUCAC02_035750 [Chaenocephalus aceratus]